MPTINREVTRGSTVRVLAGPRAGRLGQVVNIDEEGVVGDVSVEFRDLDGVIWYPRTALALQD